MLPNFVFYESAKRGASFKRAFAKQLKRAAKETSASSLDALLASIRKSKLYKHQPLVAAKNLIQLNPPFVISNEDTSATKAMAERFLTTSFSHYGYDAAGYLRFNTLAEEKTVYLAGVYCSKRPTRYGSIIRILKPVMYHKYSHKLIAWDRGEQKEFSLHSFESIFTVEHYSDLYFHNYTLTESGLSYIGTPLVQEERAWVKQRPILNYISSISSEFSAMAEFEQCEYCQVEQGRQTDGVL